MSGTKKIDFCELVEKQTNFQEFITGEKLPQDDVHNFQYHMTAIVEELGEVLKADKRWKTNRNKRFEPLEKYEEIADVFITAINIAIFSGLDGEKLLNEIDRKINVNCERLGIK